MAELFSFEGIEIERVITHKLFPREQDKKRKDPHLNNTLINLESTQAEDALERRIQEALGNKSHGIEANIVKCDEESFFCIASAMMHASEDIFIELSKTLAQNLHKAQYSTNAPGGIVTIVSGRICKQSYPFLATIKAELEDGFTEKQNDDGNMGMQYLSELLLTKNQKLYKIGFLAEVISKKPENGKYSLNNYRAFLFDHLMTATETKKSAVYFYDVFLGLSIDKTAKKITQDFFDFTKTYIKTSNLSDTEKLYLDDALRIELKNNAATINLATFSKTYFPKADQQSYLNFMAAKNIPNSFSKDTDYIKSKLKRPRRFPFSNGVKIWAPSDDNLDKYLTIEKEMDSDITIVKVKGLFIG